MKSNKKPKVLESLRKHLGVVTPACKENGISRQTYHNWYDNDPAFRQEVDIINDEQGDFVESKLFDKIKEGSERSIMFYMKYKGKKKGYSDSVDITSNGKEINEIKLIEIKRDGEKH